MQKIQFKRTSELGIVLEQQNSLLNLRMKNYFKIVAICSYHGSFSVHIRYGTFLSETHSWRLPGCCCTIWQLHKDFWCLVSKKVALLPLTRPLCVATGYQIFIRVFGHRTSAWTHTLENMKIPTENTRTDKLHQRTEGRRTARLDGNYRRNQNNGENFFWFLMRSIFLHSHPKTCFFVYSFYFLFRLFNC